jgi:hypothetical protein
MVLVDGLLYGVFGFADGLLGFAFDLLGSSFRLKVFTACGFANALLNGPSGIVGGTLNLISGAAHFSVPFALKMNVHFISLWRAPVDRPKGATVEDVVGHFWVSIASLKAPSVLQSRKVPT